MCNNNTVWMYFIKHLVLLVYLVVNSSGDEMETYEHWTLNDIADNLLSIIGINKDDRIKELQDKIAKVHTFVVDRNTFEETLVNLTKETDLNKTNFFESLRENDHFSSLANNETKSLYLKLKEKVNRDDVLKLLKASGINDKVLKRARKMMHNEDISDSAQPLNEVIDKFIAEQPRDNHKYDLTHNQSRFWDPQRELEDLNEYHKHDGRRIYRGERTTVKYYPFMVSIHVMGRFWCGGALYWNDLVLTSASCLQLMYNNRLFRENPRVLQVRVGSNHSRLGGELVDALEVYFHPGYIPRTLKNNIAVVRLRRHLFFNYHRVPKTIAISHNEHGIAPTAEILLLGWGVTKISQKLSYEPIFLQRKILPVYPNAFCKEIYGEKFISKTMFCAGTMTTGEGACDHDAGGPAILSGQLVGIISFGPAICGYPDAPTVFTLVGAFADWIETVNESMPEYYRGKQRTTTSTMSPLHEYFRTWDTSTTTTDRTRIAPIQFSTSPATTTTESLTTTTNAGSPTEETTESRPPIIRLKDDSAWSMEIY